MAIHCEICIFSEEVVSILMSWYFVTPYHIMHLDHTSEIPGNTGVRQGCVAAPFLWTTFVLRWQKRIASKLGSAWVLAHLTTFADDHHAAWEFNDVPSLLRALTEANLVLETLEEDGMQISLNKTQAILALRGTRSRSLKKKLVYKQDGELRIRLGLLSSGSVYNLPLVQQARYLGVQVSYAKSSSQCTLHHRLRQARVSYTVLRPWWGSGKLLLKDRLRLWVTCIWPSMTFGLLDVGLSPSLGLKFRTQALRQLRALAHSVVHLSLKAPMPSYSDFDKEIP